ncbi:MAG TPA: thiolase family protein, partial [Nitrosopumilaceae archaeon]|nr:thiolase family protein [Nitrosopumilaceae archaeon]
LYETQDRRINPRGGLIGAGHPLGATGIAQIAEIGQQLQGKAGKRQIPHANVGLVQNMSAAATSSSVLIMQS